jgi:CTP synthase (UTP-ammonia lyase)
MQPSLNIGVIGDFNPTNMSHTATNAAITHAAETQGMRADIRWLSTQSLNDEIDESPLKRMDGFLCAPGSPYTSMNGALRAITFCREKEWPFIGT